MRVYDARDIIDDNLYIMLRLYATKLGATDFIIYDDGKISLYKDNICICYQEDITLSQLLKTISRNDK